jgi:hypothetical protein
MATESSYFNDDDEAFDQNYVLQRTAARNHVPLLTLEEKRKLANYANLENLSATTSSRNGGRRRGRRTSRRRISRRRISRRRR